MPAVFQGAIAPQKFETIRANIANILALELAAQRDYDDTYPYVRGVDEERCIDYDASEIPCINVCLAAGDWSNQRANVADGEYIYNIDIYTSAVADTDGPADKRAMLTMTKIAGMVRSILSHNAYRTVGMAKGSVGIRPTVERFRVLNRVLAKDALSDVVGRIQFKVTAPETQETQDYLIEDINLAVSKIIIEESDKGFRHIKEIS